MRILRSGRNARGMDGHFNWTRGHVVHGLHFCLGLSVRVDADLRLSNRLAGLFSNLHDRPSVERGDTERVVVGVALERLVVAIRLDPVRRCAGLTIVDSVDQFSDIGLARWT